jgi:hypothetical protein
VNRKNLNSWRPQAKTFPERICLYNVDHNPTVFTPAYRLLALNLEEPRIEEGLRITKEMILQMQNTASAKKCKLLVLFIPTKESVYGQMVQKHKVQTPNSYKKLLEMEARNCDFINGYCRSHGVSYFDLKTALSNALADGQQIYPAGGDGHPTEQGYAVIASAVSEELKLLRWL